MLKRILLLFPALLLAASPAFAQSTTVVPDWYNAIPYCNTAGGTNCEHTMPTTPTGLVSLSVGLDGTSRGQDSSNNVWGYTDFVGWTEYTSMGTQVIGISVGSANFIVGMAATGSSLNSHCTAGGHSPYYWSTNQWVNLDPVHNPCVDSITTDGQDGSIFAIDHTTKNGEYWTGAVLTAISGGPYVACSAWGLQVKGLYCVSTTGKLYYLSNVAALTMTQDTTAPASLTTVATYAPKEAGGVWVGSSTAPGLWHNDGTTWQKMVIAAGPTNLSSGGPMMTFYTSTTRFGSSLTRFPDSLIGFTTTVNNPGGCAGCTINQGIVHNAYITTSGLNRQIGGGSSADTARPYYQNYNFQQQILTADPFYLIEGNDLSFTYAGEIDCSFLGTRWYYFASVALLQAADFSKYFNHTHLQVQNPEQCVNDNPWKGCNFGVLSWCTPDSTPPNYNPNFVKYLLTDPKDPSYLDASAVCFSNLLTGHTWKCATFGDQPTASTNSAKIECTHSTPN